MRKGNLKIAHRRSGSHIIFFQTVVQRSEKFEVHINFVIHFYPVNLVVDFLGQGAQLSYVVRNWMNMSERVGHEPLPNQGDFLPKLAGYPFRFGKARKRVGVFSSRIKLQRQSCCQSQRLDKVPSTFDCGLACSPRGIFHPVFFGQACVVRLPFHREYLAMHAGISNQGGGHGGQTTEEPAINSKSSIPSVGASCPSNDNDGKQNDYDYRDPNAIGSLGVFLSLTLFQLAIPLFFDEEKEWQNCLLNCNRRVSA